MSRHVCPECGATNGLTRSAWWLGLISAALGGVAAGAGIYSGSWLVFFVAVVSAFLLDFLIDYKLFRFRVVAAPPVANASRNEP